MVIPTMLARVVTHLGEAEDSGTPTLRSLSYGGARMPTPVLHRAMRLFSTTDFVNAYGLTETSSTIALLGPEDHRDAFVAADPRALARLGSVGRLLPGIELEVRDDEGGRWPTAELGLLFFRGEQISGEYAGGSVLDDDGWFSSRDRGRIDEDGYLFIEGRADDTIIRGGENIAPAEIEDVLIAHDGIVDAAVVGLPDDEWGQRLVAVVVGAPGTSVTADRAEGRGPRPAPLVEDARSHRVLVGAPPHRHRQAAPASGRRPARRGLTTGTRSARPQGPPPRSPVGGLDRRAPEPGQQQRRPTDPGGQDDPQAGPSGDAEEPEGVVEAPSTGPEDADDHADRS